MENIKLAVITKDKEYGRALGFALVDVYKNFTVTLYQSEPVHSQLESFDLILKDYEKGDHNRRYIYLVEKPSLTEKNYEEQDFRLYKYSNVRQLVGELLFIYSSVTGRKAIPIKNQEMRIIAFCGVEGGAGCTTASIALAQELQRFHGKRVMYLSLEEMESTLEYMEPFPDGKSISEYLYHLFNEKEEDRLPFIESFLVCDHYGVDAFLPSPGRNALKSLNAEEIQLFIGAVMDTGRYDILILDLGCSLDKNALCCYEMANNICLIAKEEKMNYKEGRFLEYLIFLKGEELVDRMAKVINGYVEKEELPEKEEATTAEEEGVLRVACRLPEDPESFLMQGNGRKSISAEGLYNQGIKLLTDSILRNVII